MSEVARLAGTAGAIGLAAAMVAPRASLRVAGLMVTVVGCAALALELAPEGHAGLYAIVGGAGLAVAVALAALFVRIPWALALVALACVPVGVDVDLGEAHGRLLVPLYATVAGAAFALMWRPRHGRDLGLVAWPLALLVALLGVSLLWSDEARAGATVLALFVLPLGVLALALARLRWRTGWSGILALELVALGVGLAIAGGVQYLTRDVAVGIGASVTSGWYFPVSPAFDDPGAYARFLVVAIVSALAIALRVRDVRVWAPAAGAAIVAWLGLVVSFSQAAFVALGAAAVVLLVAAWWARGTFPAALVITFGAAVAGSFAAVRADVLHVPGRRTGASVYDAIQVALDHPVIGLGIGARTVRNAAVTIAAEVGAGGLVLLAAAIVAAYVGLRAARTAGELALIVAVLAIAVDSVFRGELLRDPLFWGALGLSAAAARPAPVETGARRPSRAP